MTLPEAITVMQDIDLKKLSYAELDGLSLVLAAARAMACTNCGGTGKVWCTVGAYAACPDCEDDRKKVRAR